MADVSESGKIICRIDGAEVHSIQLHLSKNHPEWTLARYQETYPDAPILSEFAKQRIAARAADKKPADAPIGVIQENMATSKAAFHQVFDLGKVKAAMNKRGDPIMISVFDRVPTDIQPFVPDIDNDYVFDIGHLRTLVIGFEMGIPMLIWGYHGTGKTSLVEQFCARTKRGLMRIQHSANTEESHIIGQYVVREDQTVWQDGPLAVAMRLGMVYCADEYDFAMPNVTAVYQAVLEGKPLLIKEAPPEHRVVRPHPNFRFTATGNTNGAGDESGLYQGTNIQNAANYSRFGITIEVGYMPPKVEAVAVSGKSGIDNEVAEKLVEFAKSVRDAFASGKVGMTVSPRELINAGLLGRMRGDDWLYGLEVGYMNRLSRIDREVIGAFAQRVFGEAK